MANRWNCPAVYVIIVAMFAATGTGVCSETNELKTARDVQKAVKDRYVGDNEKRMLTLVLTNKRGEERKSSLIRYRKKEKGLWSTLLFYLDPADVRGTATLTIEVAGEDNLQRIYLPALKKNRRIPASDKSKSWAGTDFSFWDLEEHEVTEFDYGQMDSVVVDGHECYHYMTIPKAPEKAGCAKVENWIRKDILHPLQAKYYDAKGTLVKELKFKKQEKVQDIWTTLHLEMTSVLDGHKTDFITDKMVFNTEIDDSVFTERGMLKVSEKF